MTFLEKFYNFAQQQPDAPAIQQLTPDGALQTVASYQQLLDQASRLALGLVTRFGHASTPRKVGLAIENTPNWVITDLALQLLGWIEVPVPLAFSPAQAASLLKDVELILTDAASHNKMQEWADKESTIVSPLFRIEHNLYSEDYDADSLWRDAIGRVNNNPEAIVKIIHTSGTTSAPKGVRIRSTALEHQVRVLLKDIRPESLRCYLALVPLSLLIEQLFAVEVILASGGKIVFLPVGVKPFGGGDTRADDYLPHIKAANPSMMTVPPAIVESINNRADTLLASGIARDALSNEIFGGPSLPFLTCGGAPISKSTLDALAEKGINAYEGYGLSEATAVVSWNKPDRFRFGSAGMPAPQVEMKIADDGELLVKTPTLFDGYEGSDSSALSLTDDGWLKTGDIAEFDADGFLYIRGRKRNLIISSAGRNVAPEWVEATYRQNAGVHNIAVFGDSLEHLVAFIIPSADVVDDSQLISDLTELAEDQLPEYARVFEFHLLDAQQGSEYFTITGRPQRQQLWQSLGHVFTGN